MKQESGDITIVEDCLAMLKFNGQAMDYSSLSAMGKHESSPSSLNGHAEPTSNGGQVPCAVLDALQAGVSAGSTGACELQLSGSILCVHHCSTRGMSNDIYLVLFLA